MATLAVDTTFANDFNTLGALPASNKPEGFAQLLDKIIASSAPEQLETNLSAYIGYLLGGDVTINGVSQPSETLSIIASRPLLTNFISKFNELQVTNDVKTSVGQTAVRLLQPRVVSFEEQDTALKFLLADAFQNEHDFTSAAHQLQSISLDTSQRAVTDTQRADVWVRIARCYLEDDDSVAATTYINRAKNVLHNVPDKTIQLNFKMSEARILDSKRQVLDASASYHAISFETIVDEDDRLQTLSAAVVCAVLAPAGPQRARTLARLYKDDRTTQVSEFPILEKIFLDRLLAPEEVAAFAARLQPHQLARTSDGSTVLDRAVLEHNLLAASSLYRNIGIDRLGVLLGVDGERAEQYAAQMIEQGRLAGHIDQIDGVIFFTGEATSGAPAISSSRTDRDGKSEQANGEVGIEMRRWDASVLALAEEVEKVTTMIQEQFPDLYATNMV